MLVLRGSTTSPFVRKVRIAASILGLADDMRFQAADTFSPTDSVRRQNPLGKIPTLILEDGAALYDSRVILEYLDHLAGGDRIIPVQPDARFRALRLQALVDGILEAAVLIVQEKRFRSEEKCELKWIEHQSERMKRGLSILENQPPDAAEKINVGDIALASALDWLNVRFDQMGRKNYPALMRWLSGFASRVPKFEDTKPPS